MFRVNEEPSKSVLVRRERPVAAVELAEGRLRRTKNAIICSGESSVITACELRPAVHKCTCPGSSTHCSRIANDRAGCVACHDRQVVIAFLSDHRARETSANQTEST